MRIRADFDRRAAVHAADIEWVPSPVAGVERKMLDRLGEEVARATSIVRFAPDSRFAPHTHGGGEEFLVLEGVFEDEEGAYPAGTYVRNPPGSRHTPGSKPGCVLFVKLWQFHPRDRQRLVVDSSSRTPLRTPDRAGVRIAPLFGNRREQVRLERWEPGARVRYRPTGGIELLCLEGGFEEAGEAFRRLSWLRLPVGAPLDAMAGRTGCLLWVKEGHLAHIRAPGADCGDPTSVPAAAPPARSAR